MIGEGPHLQPGGELDGEKNDGQPEPGLGVAVQWDAQWWDRLTGTVRAPWLRRAAPPSRAGGRGPSAPPGCSSPCWRCGGCSPTSPGTIGETRLSGSSTAGKLTVDLNALASAAAAAVLDTPGVRSANSKAITDRGRRTVQLTITIEPTADLPTITTATDHVCHHLARALGDPDIATRIHLRTARTTHTGPRVS